MNNEYGKKLLNILIGSAILIGIPYMFGCGWLWLSWIPAIMAMSYLED